MPKTRTPVEIRPLAEHPEVVAARDRLRGLEASLRKLEDARRGKDPDAPVRRPGFYARQKERLTLEINTEARPALSEAVQQAAVEYFAPARRRVETLCYEVDVHRKQLEKIGEEARVLGASLREAGLGDTSALAGEIRRLVTLPRRMR